MQRHNQTRLYKLSSLQNMTVEPLIFKAKSKNLQDRDLSIDELADLFEYNQISLAEKEIIVREMVNLLANETQSDILESIFNLLHWASLDRVSHELIINTTIENLLRLDSSSLDHALTIVAESNLPDRQKILKPYLQSNNVATVRLVKELLKEC